MKETKLKKFERLEGIITDRINHPGMNSDFDGIFNCLMEKNYIIEDKGNWLPPIQIQTKEEKMRNAIAKFTNYAYYDLMNGKLEGVRAEDINPNKFDDVLRKEINDRAFGNRMDLEKKWGEIRGYCECEPKLRDTSERDWYKAQKDMVELILFHYGTISE